MPRKKKIKKKIKKKKRNVLFKKSTVQNAYKSNTFKTNGEKIKIKKIETQPTEKRIYNIKDYVVYPKHGVGKQFLQKKQKQEVLILPFIKYILKKKN